MVAQTSHGEAGDPSGLECRRASSMPGRERDARVARRMWAIDMRWKASWWSQGQGAGGVVPGGDAPPRFGS